MADSPPRPPKPKISLQIPANNQPAPNLYTANRVPSTAGSNSVFVNPLFVPNFTPGNFNNMQPMTPVTALPQSNPYYNPFVNPGKASEFMFKQFEGFKDFTMNTAKSGLSVGEKSAFWMYNKVSAWSKKWFTHIFLFMVIMAYTAAGAAIFMAVEGVHETTTNTDMRERRTELVNQLQKMNAKIHLNEDPEQWKGEALKYLLPYELELEQSIKQGYVQKGKKVWTFWNAVFYCGTIYTTIGELV